MPNLMIVAAALVPVIVACNMVSRPEERVQRSEQDAANTGMPQPTRQPSMSPESKAEMEFVQYPPLAKTDAEKAVLSVLDGLEGQREKNMNAPRQDVRLLRLMAEAMGAKHVVEIGTSNGYSGLWFCLALRNTGGKLTTYEIDAGRAALARENFKKAGVDNIVTLIEGDAHNEVTKLEGPIDIVFLDADKPGYVDYLKKLLPLVRPGGVVMAHNMVRPVPINPQYVEAITTDPNLETVFVNMDDKGVGLTLKKR